jgi:predicted nuclease of predicted toxin-antitoxin system
MNLLIDMNLSPAWVQVLAAEGHVAVHWSTVGSPRAPDSELLGWARINGFVVFTHDLDFGAILAATSAVSPSVIQIRTRDPTPEVCSEVVLSVLRAYAAVLREGALVSVDRERSRAHILPLGGTTP